MSKQIISHSEVDCFNKCSRRHYYQYGEKLARKKHSDALTRGIFGHKVFLEAFMRTLQETGNWQKSMEALDIACVKELMSGGTDPAIVHTVIRITKGWLETFRDRVESWEILSVEEEKRLDMGAFIFAFTTDLVVSESGARTIFDVKFVYDFYSGDLLDLLPQVPRYVGGERALDFVTRRGGYIFVRHRNLKNVTSSNDLYRISPIPIDAARIKNAFRDVANAAERIADLKALSLQEWEKKTSRVADVWTCKTCPMKDLCAAELNGSDGRLLRMTEYEPSKYGYVPED